MTTWVLVAQRAGARVYHRSAEGDLTLVAEIEHPAGRLRDRDIDTDRPGATFDSSDHGRHAFEPEETAHERDAANFAREVARWLAKARHEKRFQGLVLVAEPGFLGVLRGALDRPTSLRVIGTRPKDLGRLGEHEMKKQLHTMLDEAS